MLRSFFYQGNMLFKAYRPSQRRHLTLPNKLIVRKPMVYVELVRDHSVNWLIFQISLHCIIHCKCLRWFTWLFFWAFLWTPTFSGILMVALLPIHVPFVSVRFANKCMRISNDIQPRTKNQLIHNTNRFTRNLRSFDKDRDIIRALVWYKMDFPPLSSPFYLL